MARRTLLPHVSDGRQDVAAVVPSWLVSADPAPATCDLNIYEDLARAAANNSQGCPCHRRGDWVEVMGSNNTGELSGYHRAQPGWTTPTTVTSTQTVFLAPLESQDRVVLRIPWDAANPDASTAYWVEWRQPLGADAYLVGRDWRKQTKGATIWQVTPNRDADYLLDLTPRTDSWTDADLASGKSFVGAAGITITVGPAINGRLPVFVTR